MIKYDVEKWHPCGPAPIGGRLADGVGEKMIVTQNDNLRCYGRSVRPVRVR